MSSPVSPGPWRREIDDHGTWTLWFDQPGRAFNVLDRPAIDALESHLADAESASSITALVLRSGKPGGFCAGADLKALHACKTSGDVELLLRRGETVIERLAAAPFPTLTVLHGVSLGGGLELALACRRRVALASEAPLHIGAPEIHLGLVPAWGALTRLPRLIGPAHAIDLLVSGRSIGYLRARSLGIVDKLAAQGEDLGDLADEPRTLDHAPPEDWRAAVDHARADIIDQPGEHPDVQEQILELIELDLDQGPAAAREAAVKLFAELAMAWPEREAVRSFLERSHNATDH